LTKLKQYRGFPALFIGVLIATGAAQALDRDEIGGSILPTKYPAISSAWANEYCDLIADYRVTVDTGAPSGHSADYIALAKEVDRTVAKTGGNGYIWLSVGWAKDREEIENIGEPFVEIETWDCEQLPWASWEEMLREHWPDLVQDR